MTPATALMIKYMSLKVPVSATAVDSVSTILPNFNANTNEVAMGHCISHEMFSVSSSGHHTCLNDMSVL
ncbi:hypothetical protein L798_15549 [Zootermopsis nevadensis]|uniref:Uncharacterized protein n=1 Tax=Zootermopsis nevadensis TaxID=136037 RepID=A0A067QPF9_ZOONE|nr:hypothetical protein L798_15549 [Zootermopsis nevadensis]